MLTLTPARPCSSASAAPASSSASRVCNAPAIRVPPAAYPLREAAQAWEAQASSPGKKIIVIP